MDSIKYFPNSGDWTDDVLELCRAFSEANNIRDMVIASMTGESGAKASKLFRGYNLVVVAHSAGFKDPGKLKLLDEYRRVIDDNGRESVDSNARAQRGREVVQEAF